MSDKISNADPFDLSALREVVQLRAALAQLLAALDATLPTAWQWGPQVNAALDRARAVLKGGGR